MRPRPGATTRRRCGRPTRTPPRISSRGTEAAYTTNNTLLKFFFRQEGAEADVLGAAYRDYLGDDEIQTIKTAGVGSVSRCWATRSTG